MVVMRITSDLLCIASTMFQYDKDMHDLDFGEDLGCLCKPCCHSHAVVSKAQSICIVAKIVESKLLDLSKSSVYICETILCYNSDHQIHCIHLESLWNQGVVLAGCFELRMRLV